MEHVGAPPVDTVRLLGATLVKRNATVCENLPLDPGTRRSPDTGRTQRIPSIGKAFSSSFGTISSLPLLFTSVFGNTPSPPLPPLPLYLPLTLGNAKNVSRGETNGPSRPRAFLPCPRSSFEAHFRFASRGRGEKFRPRITRIYVPIKNVPRCASEFKRLRARYIGKRGA